MRTIVEPFVLRWSMAHLSAFWLPLSVSIATATIPFTPSFLSHWFFCNHIPLTSLNLSMKEWDLQRVYFFFFSLVFFLIVTLLGFIVQYHSFTRFTWLFSRTMHVWQILFVWIFLLSLYKHWETKGLQWLCTLLLVSFGVWNVEQQKE